MSTSARRSEAGFLRLEELFARQAARTPHHIALVDGDREFTYAAVDRRATLIAGKLASLGIAPGELVGIHLERTAQLPMAILGLFKAGIGYVPLDAVYPAERLAYMAQAAELRYVLVDSGTEAPSWMSEGIVPLALDPADDLEQYASFDRVVDPTEDSTGYVLFTSGSTGRPKGVVMPHGPVVNLVQWHSTRQGLSDPARTLQFAPMGFDVSSQEMFTTWLTGGTLVLVSEAVRRSPFALLDHLVKHRVERLFLPFAAVDGLCQAVLRKRPDLSALRDIATAGEQLRITPAIRETFGTYLRARLRNQYGPTETHIVTEHVLDGDPAAWPALPPIGVGMPGVRLLVVDENGAAVSGGGVGELLVGGEQLADGYLSRPDLTAERFVDVPGFGRAYHTGDLVQLGEDGDVHFLSRMDGQVKIRGFRVELGEVEAVVSEAPGVRGVTITAEPDPTGTMSLTSYIVGEFADSASATAAVRAHASRLLPEYMVPGRVVLVDALPTTANGKVARDQLVSRCVAGAAS